MFDACRYDRSEQAERYRAESPCGSGVVVKLRAESLCHAFKPVAREVLGKSVHKIEKCVLQQSRILRTPQNTLNYRRNRENSGNCRYECDKKRKRVDKLLSEQDPFKYKRRNYGKYDCRKPYVGSE